MNEIFEILLGLGDKFAAHIVLSASAEQDLEVRGQLLAQAEAIALRDHALIPEFFGVNRAMVQPYLDGWVTNVNDNVRTRWLSIDESARAERFPSRYGN